MLHAVLFLPVDAASCREYLNEIIQTIINHRKTRSAEIGTMFYPSFNQQDVYHVLHRSLIIGPH